jgi:hypothetical protein
MAVGYSVRRGAVSDIGTSVQPRLKPSFRLRLVCQNFVGCDLIGVNVGLNVRDQRIVNFAFVWTQAVDKIECIISV